MVLHGHTERVCRGLELVRLMRWTLLGARVVQVVAVLNTGLIVIAGITADWTALALGAATTVALAGTTTLLRRYADRLCEAARALLSETRDAVV